MCQDELFNLAMTLLGDNQEVEVELKLIQYLRRLSGDEELGLTRSSRYLQILSHHVPVIKKLLGFLADSSRPPAYLQHLTWFLLNIFCFPECEANLFFEEQCGIVETGCLAIQRCNQELAGL